MTSWETVQLQPTFTPYVDSHQQHDSFAGWHTLVLQVSDGSLYPALHKL